MAPEYGATMGFFPVDEATVEYFGEPGADEEEIAAFQSYFKAQELYGIPRKGQIDYSRELELDLDTVAPSLAGPRRPQDRIELANIKSRFIELFSKPVSESGYGKNRRGLGSALCRGVTVVTPVMQKASLSPAARAGITRQMRHQDGKKYYRDGQQSSHPGKG